MKTAIFIILLSYAVHINARPVVKISNENKSFVNNLREIGNELHYAALDGDDETVDSIIKSGGDVNSEDQDGSTALDYAAWNGHEQVVNVLFNHGATVDHVDHVRGMTALQISANRGHRNIVALLIKNEANVNHIDNLGYSVLDWTPHKEYPEIAKLLLKNGAKLNRMTWSNQLINN